MAPIQSFPLQHSYFSLDASGVAGFFGGNEAISAMSTVHLFKGRRWVGWFNSPGSYTIGKCYGRLANSRWWDGLFPGQNNTPAEMFELDGKKGPTYIGTSSGTRMTSGHLGHLLWKKCQESPVINVQGRQTTGATVSVVELKHGGDSGSAVPVGPYHMSLLAIIPMFASISACVCCALAGDWWAFAMILLGIVAGGVSCFVIGSGKAVLKYPGKPADGCPPGDGFFMGEGQDIVVVKGAERFVNILTKGRFEIELAGGPVYRRVGVAAMLLELQFLLQLLLVPQAQLFGQIMFVSSLAISWMYTSYVSSIDKEKIQADLLWSVLGEPKIQKYSVGGRSASAVLTALVLQPEEPEKVLKEFVGNDTRVWRKWREVVSEWIKSGQPFGFGVEDLKIKEFNDNERELYQTILHQNARNGYNAYQLYEATQGEKYQDEKMDLWKTRPVEPEQPLVRGRSPVRSPIYIEDDRFPSPCFIIRRSRSPAAFSELESGVGPRHSSRCRSRSPAYHTETPRSPSPSTRSHRRDSRSPARCPARFPDDTIRCIYRAPIHPSPSYSPNVQEPNSRAESDEDERRSRSPSLDFPERRVRGHRRDFAESPDNRRCCRSPSPGVFNSHGEDLV